MVQDALALALALCTPSVGRGTRGFVLKSQMGRLPCTTFSRTSPSFSEILANLRTKPITGKNELDFGSQYSIMGRGNYIRFRYIVDTWPMIHICMKVEVTYTVQYSTVQYNAFTREGTLAKCVPRCGFYRPLVHRLGEQGGLVLEASGGG